MRSACGSVKMGSVCCSSRIVLLAEALRQLVHKPSSASEASRTPHCEQVRSALIGKQIFRQSPAAMTAIGWWKECGCPRTCEYHRAWQKKIFLATAISPQRTAGKNPQCSHEVP